MKAYRSLACACFPVALETFLATTFRTFLGVSAFGVLAASTVIYCTWAYN